QAKTAAGAGGAAVVAAVARKNPLLRPHLLVRIRRVSGIVYKSTGTTFKPEEEPAMSELHDTASHVKDFLSGLSANPNMPNLKTVVGKLTSLPGVSQFKGIQIQMLRVQEEILKGQLAIIGQIIQAIEGAPEASAPCPEATQPEPPANGKIVVS